jgi:hypothetical protein
MNYHTAKMVAAKHGKKLIRDNEDNRFYFEERDGTPLFDLSGDALKAMTTAGLEQRLGVEQEGR